jgi:hypothetical protein
MPLFQGNSHVNLQCLNLQYGTKSDLAYRLIAPPYTCGEYLVRKVVAHIVRVDGSEVLAPKTTRVI